MEQLKANWPRVVNDDQAALKARFSWMLAEAATEKGSPHLAVAAYQDALRFWPESAIPFASMLIHQLSDCKSGIAVSQEWLRLATSITGQTWNDSQVLEEYLDSAHMQRPFAHVQNRMGSQTPVDPMLFPGVAPAAIVRLQRWGVPLCAHLAASIFPAACILQNNGDYDQTESYFKHMVALGRHYRVPAFSLFWNKA